MFCNNDYEETEELRNHMCYQDNELLAIDSFKYICRHRGSVEILVSSKGFVIKESDWFSVESLREDVPDRLSDYLIDICGTGNRY